jgi:hypothetical protein
VGVAQKTVLAGCTLIQWAGTAVAARAAVNALVSTSKGGNRLIDVPAVLTGSGLSSSELKAISLIYHFSDKSLTRRYSHNCENYESGPFVVSSAGSGVWDFIENTTIT